MMARMLSWALPWWGRCLLMVLAAGALFGLGQLRGERIAGQAYTDYLLRQSAAATTLAHKEIQVLVKTETEYRDRIRTVFVKGDVIEKQVPVLVDAADNLRFGVNAGFVRLYDAAWSGDDAVAATAVESDHEPAAVSLSDVAAAEVHNATSCRAWREQALGLKAYYARLQALRDTNQDPQK